MYETHHFNCFIPCAGFGSRLKPITETTPKPLISVFDVPLFDITASQILNCSPELCLINTHYLADKMKRHAESRWPGRIIVEIEASKILGTGGGIGNIKGKITQLPLLVYNGDILSDLDINLALSFHAKVQADVTMVVLPNAIPGENSIYLNGDRIVGIGPTVQCPTNCSAHGFTGIHILSPAMIDRLPQFGEYSIISEYLSAITSGAKFQAMIHSGNWFDLGSPAKYFLAHQILLQQWKNGGDSLKMVFRSLNPEFEGSLAIELDDACYISSLAHVDGEATIKNYSVVLAGSQIRKAATVDCSLTLENSAVAAGSVAKSLIVGNDWVISV